MIQNHTSNLKPASKTINPEQFSELFNKEESASTKSQTMVQDGQMPVSFNESVMKIVNNSFPQRFLGDGNAAGNELVWEEKLRSACSTPAFTHEGEEMDDDETMATATEMSQTEEEEAEIDGPEFHSQV